jgi:DNA polymerase I - 3''-5'' exonuclease and polymerase domains
MTISEFAAKYGTVLDGIIKEHVYKAPDSELVFVDEALLEQVVSALLYSNFTSKKRGYLTKFEGSHLDFMRLQGLIEKDKGLKSLITIIPSNIEICIADELEDMLNNIRLECARYDDDRSRGEIKVLSIDIETYSSNDITSGVYKYCEAPDFEVLLMSYSINGGVVHQYDFTMGDQISDEIREAIFSPNVLKTAYNAVFERICLSRHFRLWEDGTENKWNSGWRLDPAQWECTMVRGAMWGLPMSLDACGEALNLKDKKMKEGKALIKFFSCPCKPTKKNGMRTRNYPSDDMAKWKVYKRYNCRDTEVESAIRNRVTVDKITDFERQLYIADQRINDRGVKIEQSLMSNAIRFNAEYCQRLEDECRQLTGLENPNSPQQLKNWLSAQIGRNISSLTKDLYKDLMQEATGDARRVLEIRTELSKTSVSKYTAMQGAICSDGRVHGMLQFYGSRTGRWAGRIVQLQNLPKNKMPDLDLARQCVMSGDLELTEMLYGNIPDTLSQLIRTTFVAKEGHTYMVCDFSAIEARVIAWLAGEEWRLEVFRGDGKIYEASAARMFHVPASEITHDDPRRAKGKIAELALGYQGGIGALKKMGGEKMGLSDDEMTTIVNDWRNASPAIVLLWRNIENAARQTITTHVDHKCYCLLFRMCGNVLRVKLPSGRWLSYPSASVDFENHISFMGQNQTTRRWEPIDTYGGKLVENIVQAIARDCLGTTMLRLEQAGYPIVFHIHDECICEVIEDGSKSLKEMQSIFALPIEWAKDLPLKGAGYTTKYYLKD